MALVRINLLPALAGAADVARSAHMFWVVCVVVALSFCTGCGPAGLGEVESSGNETIDISEREAADRVRARLGELAKDAQFRRWRGLPNLTVDQLTVGKPIALYGFSSEADGRRLWKDLKNQPEGYIIPVLLDGTPVATAGLDWSDEQGYFYYTDGEFAPDRNLTPEYTALARVTLEVKRIVGDESTIKCVSGGFVVPGCAIGRKPGGTLVVAPYGTHPSVGDVSDPADLAAWEKALARFEDYEVYTGAEAEVFLRTAYFWN